MQEKKRPVYSLSSKIFFGFGLGIVTGLFFGDMVGWLKVVGDVYINLLQMTVLPYVILSLIIGLASLDYHQAVLLARKGVEFNQEMRRVGYGYDIDRRKLLLEK